MTLAYHNPPGFSTDLREENKIRWSEWISSIMDSDRNAGATQFYNATKTEEKEPTANRRITWVAFPRNVTVENPNDRARWREADQKRSVQDEYCEWSIKRNAAGKMVRIVFCNEGPEYYRFLGDHQPDTLFQLYQEHNPGVGIQKADLFHPDPESGRTVYNPENRWNNATDTGTIMHLIQVNNTLAAQINLGADATIIRKRSDGTVITDRDELIRCGRFGGVERNSDPQIGAEVNTLARAGAMVTIQDPVGLYIDSINWGLIQPPSGHDDDLSQFWKWTRGTQDHRMRAEFEIPADKGYVLGDLFVRGIPLEFGGQLADIITIALIGRASDVGGNNQAKPIPCVGAAPRAAATFKVAQDGGTGIYEFRA
jgi:hypothetical protein